MRSLFTACLLLLSSISFAQSAKPFKVTIAGGYAVPTYQGDNILSKAGFLYSIEPQYELLKHIDVGFRFEQAFIKRPEFIDKTYTYLSKANSTLSAALTANYVAGAIKAFRPYVGLGVGLYYVAASEQSLTPTSPVNYPLPTTVNIGGLARVGVKFKFIHIEADYNLIGDTSVKNSANNLTLNAKNSYFAVKAGLTIGGSR